LVKIFQSKFFWKINEDKIFIEAENVQKIFSFSGLGKFFTLSSFLSKAPQKKKMQKILLT
jgi:threonine dehydratase